MTHLARSWRQAPSERPARSAAAVLAAALAIAGCMEPQDDDDVAVGETSHALAASLDLVGITDSFEVSAALALLPVALARPRILLDVRSALLASVVNRTCVNVETADDGAVASVTVTYDDCPAGWLRLVELDGSLTAELQLETAPCAAGECPTAVRFTLRTGYLRIGERFGERFTEMDGEWQLYDPVPPGLPTRWESSYGVRNHLESSSSGHSSASWLVEGRCVTLDIDTEFEVQQRANLRTVAASARGLTQCQDECPSSGTVQVAYGLGKILAWEYTGMDTAVVTGPRGQSFEVALPCGEE
jgi:hypothetical protein